jgi:cytochrome c-type biogenesis protein CcmF
LLEVGDSMQIEEYTLTFEDVSRTTTSEKEIFQTTIGVSRDGDSVTTLYPQRNFHLAQQQPQSEVAIRTTPVEDLYVVVAAFDPDGAARIHAFVNPLTWWIWAGAAVMLLGMGVVISGNAPTAVAETATRSTSSEPAVAGVR